MSSRRKLRVRLVHWKEAELAERAKKIRAAGHTALATSFGPRYGEEMAKPAPDVYLIDLSRLPSHGLEAGNSLRSHKKHGHVPVVFVGGAPDKLAKVRRALPDAIYCEWDGVAAALDLAAVQQLQPKARRAQSGAYSTTPLWKKLGLKVGGKLALSSAPKDFVKQCLSDLPEDCTVQSRATGQPNILLWFVRSSAELKNGLAAKRRFADGAGLWVAWPKQESGVATDLNRDSIRNLLLADGLVDIKVCAVDSTWSGVRFAFRKS